MVAKGRRTAREKAADVRALEALDRPLPPEYLNKAAQKEWREIVETYPADRFPRGTWPMLEGYVVHTVEQRRIMGMLDGVGTDTPLSQYNSLLSMLDRESKAVASFGVRLGIARTSAAGRHNNDPETVAERDLPWSGR
jgi:hypothetical protein